MQQLMAAQVTTLSQAKVMKLQSMQVKATIKFPLQAILKTLLSNTQQAMAKIQSTDMTITMSRLMRVQVATLSRATFTLLQSMAARVAT